MGGQSDRERGVWRLVGYMSRKGLLLGNWLEFTNYVDL